MVVTGEATSGCRVSVVTAEDTTGAGSVVVVVVTAEDTATTCVGPVVVVTTTEDTTRARVVTSSKGVGTVSGTGVSGVRVEVVGLVAFSRGV